MNPSFYASQIRTRLNTTDPRASTSARLRALMPYIETRLAEGAPHSAIVEDLREAGLPVPIKTFRAALYRYRKQSRRQSNGFATPAFNGGQP